MVFTIVSCIDTPYARAFPFTCGTDLLRLLLWLRLLWSGIRGRGERLGRDNKPVASTTFLPELHGVLSKRATRKLFDILGLVTARKQEVRIFQEHNRLNFLNRRRAGRVWFYNTTILQYTTIKSKERRSTIGDRGNAFRRTIVSCEWWSFSASTIASFCFCNH